MRTLDTVVFLVPSRCLYGFFLALHFCLLGAIQLPASIVIDYPTTALLAAHLLERVRPSPQPKLHSTLLSDPSPMEAQDAEAILMSIRKDLDELRCAFLEMREDSQRPWLARFSSCMPGGTKAPGTTNSCGSLAGELATYEKAVRLALIFDGIGQAPENALQRLRTHAQTEPFASGC